MPTIQFCVPDNYGSPRRAIEKVVAAGKEARRDYKLFEELIKGLDELEKQLSFLQNDLTIGCVGTVNSGKTKILNCLNADPSCPLNLVLEESAVRNTLTIQAIFPPGQLEKQGGH